LKFNFERNHVVGFSSKRKTCNTHDIPKDVNIQVMEIDDIAETLEILDWAKKKALESRSVADKLAE